MSAPHSDWAPFRLAPCGEFPLPPRSLHSIQGIGDRLRAAAFAEIQARDAFRWAAERYEDAPENLKGAWKALAHAEQRHLDWLLARMQELGVDCAEREVSDQLWHSLTTRGSAREFAIYMAGAEERGRRAGERFYENLRERDSKTAEIFRKIAEEEISHIELARRYFPESQESAR